MRFLTILIAAAVLTGLPLTVGAEAYDKAVVVQNMRDNVARISVIKKAIADGDFHAAGKAFFQYGDEAATIRKMDPPKGSKEVWEKVWGDFQDTAFLGVGACGERDGEKSLRILDEIVALNKVGHPAFR